MDDYLASQLLFADPQLDRTLNTNAAAGLPSHDVSPAQGKFLHILARSIGARRILEIGTLGGYSTIWLARAVPPDGIVVSLEVDGRHAEIARENIARAGMDARVDLRIGPALSALPIIEQEGGAPFDLVFIDADKPNNPDYLKWAIRLARPGALIIGDNVIRAGAILDCESDDDRIQGVRKFLEFMGEEKRLCATAIQTVGQKGWDGFSIAILD